VRCGRCGEKGHAAENCPELAARQRWAATDVEWLEELARGVDAKRRDYVRSCFSLLLWHNRPEAGGVDGVGAAFGAMPEEVLHNIMLRACPDAGLATVWRDTFAAVAEHAALANEYARRSEALTAWRREAAAARCHGGMAAEATEARLSKLSDEYDGALRAQARMRRRTDVVTPGDKAQRAGERSHARALRSIATFAEAARRVLYGLDELGRS
jgi:hypothetical protein